VRNLQVDQESTELDRKSIVSFSSVSMLGLWRQFLNRCEFNGAVAF
jgi:hypothetical protein